MFILLKYLTRVNINPIANNMRVIYRGRRAYMQQMSKPTNRKGLLFEKCIY